MAYEARYIEEAMKCAGLTQAQCDLIFRHLEARCGCPRTVCPACGQPEIDRRIVHHIDCSSKTSKSPGSVTFRISPPLDMTEDEQAVMDHILAAVEGIQDWGLQANGTELAIHTHGLQSFAIQHMLARQPGGTWSSWFER